MTYLTKPKLHHPKLPTNELGFTRRDYEGAVSTLCAGCGHDSISARDHPGVLRTRPAAAPGRQALRHRLLLEDARPTSSGPATASTACTAACPRCSTGANLANRDLIYLGVSGDGDSASIGLGQFAHCLRRGVNMVYIVENNGVYGLTKGQFSATADKGSKSKKGVGNQRLADRPRQHGAAARRDLRGPQLLGRQDAARAADQGGDPAPRRGLHRLHQPVRRLQQPSRLDQELRLRARAQRGGEPPRRDRGPRRDHGRLRAGHGRARHAARRLGLDACASSRPTTTRPTA